MTPAELMLVGGILVGTLETIIAALDIKPNSTIELIIAVAKTVFRTSLLKK
ncbi:hypothetical protein UFOVP649_95 [uncultured Caudovirales phage]|uniref:Uncharacterized protein n=1 Tax=uncultured Caudovirales phage TaxID=2100421 RepID=A0A6J5NDG5_9CAUD|nr:hypothetical protein UFOVP649_95 [uncultured Caudovirales phage]